MNAHQTRYALALATETACIAAARAAYPAEPTSTDFDGPEWDAHFEALEDVDVRTGLNAARNERFDAEQALIAWGKTTPAARISGVNFDDLAAWPTTRAKLLDMLARVA